MTFSFSALNWLRLPSCSCSTSKQSIIYRCFLFSNSFPLQSANVAWSIQRKRRSKIIGGRILSVASPFFLLFLASMSPLSLFSEDKLRGRRAKVEKILVKGSASSASHPFVSAIAFFSCRVRSQPRLIGFSWESRERLGEGWRKGRWMEWQAGKVEDRGGRKGCIHGWMDGY